MIRTFHTMIFLIVSALAMVAVVFGACSSAPVSNNSPADKPAAQSPVQPSYQSPAQSAAPQAASTSPSAAPAAAPKVPALSTRVDVIYSHMNQRCPTCLCFEEHINTVIEKYFGETIASGKLTYKVLNAQDAQNSAFVKKFKAVGSQLFINTVVNGFDNIDDIQAI